MTVYNIPLSHIQANPWQTRSVPPAPEYIKELALDIVANGLLQIPIGRFAGEGGEGELEGAPVQLAFGHNRLAAYRWLYDLRDNSDIKGDWSKMPVDVRVLSDEQMAVMAWAENEKRRDVTAIERARAIQQRLDHFKWNNRKCGEALGLDHSTISNLLRLLKLPEDLQKAIQDGQLSERQAQAILPVFEAPESHASGNEYYYGSPTGIMKAALEGESSDSLRGRVERYFANVSQDLSKAEFKLNQLLPEGGPIYCGLCNTCDRRMASRNRCFDKECFMAKTAFIHREYLKKASQASGYGLVDDKKGGHTSQLPWEKEKFERILGTKCPNLVLEYSYEKTEHCIINGFPHARLVCEKRNDSCSCIKGLRAAVAVEPEQKGWQEDEEETEVDVPDQDDPVQNNVIAMPAPLSAGELEDAARQARKAKAEALKQLPEVRKRLEEHLYQELVIDRPGAYYAAIHGYCWASEDALDMDLIFRTMARKAAAVILPDSSDSMGGLMKTVNYRLEQLKLDPLDGHVEASPAIVEPVIMEF